ncbi:MAG TPA: O-antigen ligase family protein, partial [Planctomycetota bacterium]|nr:O-antigen ligase family protein [Planctomycetota bacterium]
MEGRRALALLAPMLILPWLGSAWLRDFDVLRLPVGCAGAVALAVALLARLRGSQGLAVHGRALVAVSAALVLWIVVGLGRAVNLFDAVSQLSLAAAGTIAFTYAASTRCEELPRAMALVGAGVAVCGLGQVVVGAIPTATLGNGNYAGTFAAICLPLAIAGGWDSKTSLSKALMGVASFALAIFVIVSSSRGAQVAALVTAFPLMAARVRAGLSKRTLVVLGSATAGALILGVALLGSIRSDWLTRWGAIADPDYKSNRVRLDIWAGSLQMLAESPLQGVGPGNFDKRFPAYRREGEFRAHHRDLSPKEFVMVENAHNGFIQAAVEGGAIGLGLIVALLVIA